MLKINNLYKSYLPKGKFSISGCGTKIVEKHTAEELEFDQQFAVNNVSISLKKNQILAILGENGSGKSTLLKMIAGLIEPDFGEIILNNVKVGGPDSKLVAGHDNIKLIHQNYNLFPNISLADNIRYSMRFFSESYQKEKLEELLELCNLTEISNKLPRFVSGGEQQRTAIAGALASDIDLLLLDEPFSNLDVFNREELKGYIKKIARKTKVSILFVTHDAEDALSVSKYISIMKNGKIIQTDTPEKIYNQPNSIYVSKISGHINLLKYNTLKELIPVHRTKIYGLRSESIEVSTSSNDLFHFKGIIKNRSFLGAYNRYTILLNSTQETVLIQTPNLFETGSTVYLRFATEKIISFDKVNY